MAAAKNTGKHITAKLKGWANTICFCLTASLLRYWDASEFFVVDFWRPQAYQTPMLL